MLWVKRKNETISIVAITDSVVKEIEVAPGNSLAYWSNILYTFGIGMLIDKNNPKRYTYPKRIYVNSADTLNRYFRYSQENHRGEWRLHFSLPYAIRMSMTPENEQTQSNTSFFGLSLGLDYYHTRNQFIHAGVTVASGFLWPVPGPFDLSGTFEFTRSKYISLSNNYRIKRFTLGYGFSYAKNTFEVRYYKRFDPPPPTREPVKKSHHSIGLVFPAYYQTGPHSRIGIVYRPSFFRPDIPDKWMYEHFISLDFVWKIRLVK